MKIRDYLKYTCPDEYPEDFCDYLVSELVYIAGPYMHPDPRVREERFQALTKFAGEQMADHVEVYSPITHNHPIATMVDLPRDWSFWKFFDERMLSRSRLLVVYCLPGWDKSIGVAAEIEFAKTRNILTVYIKPNARP